MDILTSYAMDVLYVYCTVAEDYQSSLEVLYCLTYVYRVRAWDSPIAVNTNEIVVVDPPHIATAGFSSQYYVDEAAFAAFKCIAKLL